MLAVVPLPQSLTPRADAAASLQVSQDIPAQTLIGNETPVDITFSNSSAPGTTTAYNLTFSVTLPPGVTLSSSDESPTSSFAIGDPGDPSGTVYVWRNMVDIVPGSVYHFRYSFQHDVGTGPDQWQVNDEVDTTLDSYVSDTDSQVPTITPSGGNPVEADADGFDSQVTTPGSTILVPVLLTKSEPSPEAELLRGVHDHQTVYTLTLDAGETGDVGLGVVEDYIPAGIEFLGCGTGDNSRTEEYPGSGPLNPGNAPAAPDCIPPDTVETVNNPDGLPGGVYTHVTWNVGTNLPASSTSTLQYVAGIPQRENTMDWPGITPPPGGGRQASNLDNNTGPLTTQVDEGTTWTNQAQVDTTFGGVPSTVTDTEAVQAVDLSVQKYVDQPEIEQGGISTWTLQLQTSEYVVDDGVAGLTIQDVTPDGTCPIGSVRTCSATTPEPAPAYTNSQVDLDGAGTTRLTWDLSTFEIDANRTGSILFSTQALTQYANGAPVSANDSWTNTATLDAQVTTFDERGKDDPDGYLERDVDDDTSRSQSGTAITLTKDVGVPADGQACSDGVGVNWQPDVANGVGPGDRVCWRLTVIAPANLDTRDVDLVDFLPPGFRYEPGTSTSGPENEVDPDIVDGANASGPETIATGQRIEWELIPGEVVRPAQTVQIVFSTVLDGGVTPDLGEPGDVFTNEARYSFRNTNGEVFVHRDDAGVTFSEAHLGLTKQISALDGTAITPPVDQLRDVVGGNQVTYAITVANDGDRDALNATIWDLLPRNVSDDGLDATCGQITAIDHGGACSAGRISWQEVTIPAGGNVVLHYTWTLPPAGDVPVGTQWTNHAGVRDYFSPSNDDSAPRFRYVPRDNIDPSLEPSANTDRADDTADVFTPGVTLTKSRTTSITDDGNREADQATIGETISYTVEGRQPGGTAADDFTLLDSIPAGQQLQTGTIEVVAGSVDADADACAYGAGAVDVPFTNTATQIQVGPLNRNAPDPAVDVCLRLTFDVVVVDVAANRRPDNVSNTATLTYDYDNGVDTPVPSTVTASVSTQIVEPNITIDKRSSAATTVVPGADVDYQLVVTNTSDTAVSAAHDLVVVDDYDQGQVATVTNISNGGTAAGGQITWNIDDLAPGASVTLTYTAQLDSPLVAGGTITNTAEVTATSIAADDPGGDADERTAGSACSPASCPGYIDDDSVTLTVAGAALTKSTSTPTRTIGSEATYTLRAEFPAGLIFNNASVRDNLSGGRTTYLRTLDVTCATCSTADLNQFVYPEDNTTAGGNPRWDIGDLANSALTRIYTITYVARVENQPSIGVPPAPDTTLTNTATLAYNGADRETDTAQIAIAEPDVSIVKLVETDVDSGLAVTTNGDPARGEIGETITYQLALTNDGAWPAYDVAVTDEPDTVATDGCTTGTPRLMVDDVSDGALYEVTDDELAAGDGCLGFNVPVILPGATVRITYTLAVPDDFTDLVAGPEFVNEATVTEYFGLPEARRTGGPDFVREYPDTQPNAFGYVDLDGGELGDTVWLDRNGDGVQTADEPGIPDVGVTVVWAGPGDTVFGNGNDVTYERTTDEDGIWLTDDSTGPPPHLLPPGSYRVTIDTDSLPDGLTPTYDADGIGTPSVSATTLDENESDLGQDFGYDGTGSLGDFVWLDLDADGVQDSGEPGIPSVDLTATWAGFDGTLGTDDDVDYGTVTTDADGLYTVEDLPAGDVRVTVVTTTLPDGLEATYDLDGDEDDTAVRELAAGEDATDVDFGYGGTATVGDFVWFDIDGDGVQDLDEPGLGGVDVEVTWWGFDGVFGGGPGSDDITVTTTTGPAGGYLVEGVPAGRVRVTVDDDTLPGDVVPTFDLDGIGTPHTALRDITTGEDARNVDFGYRGTLTIGDLVWLDVDSDTFGPDTPGPDADPDEPPVPGVRLTVTWAGPDDNLATQGDNVILATNVETGANGRWEVVGVPAGVIRVGLGGQRFGSLRVSYDREGARDGVGIARVTATDRDFDFGLAGTASLGDDVWLDFNRNGAIDAGEPPIPGVSLSTRWAGFDDIFGNADDVDIDPVTTGGLGKYEVDNVPSGISRVVVDPTTLPAGLAPVYDLDGGNDNRADRELDPAENATDVDFGYVGTGRIGDYVWWDLDGDGVQDPTEPGLAGVAVTLDWAGFDNIFGNADDGQLKTATDGKGGYLFTGLPAGDYRVTVTKADLPAGVRTTADPDGGADSVAALTLAGGASNLTQDFGYVGTAEIGDLVWRDVNRDGDRQADEPALAGAGVSVRYLGPDGVDGTDDDVTVKQVTGDPPTTQPRARGGVPVPGDPYYRVTGLAPGRYVVTLDGDTVQSPDAPISDFDGGDPTVTTLTLTDTPMLDADFAVFQNDVPEFDDNDAAGAGIKVECDGSVVIDPFAFVTDANGDRLRIVKGSIDVPEDVVATVTDNGRLKISTTGNEDFVVRYQVSDGRGGVVKVKIPVEVSKDCASDSGTDDGGLPGTGSDLPAWAPWLGLSLLLAGAALTVSGVRRRRG